MMQNMISEYSPLQLSTLATPLALPFELRTWLVGAHALTITSTPVDILDGISAQLMVGH